jgi:hypothetical protein
MRTFHGRGGEGLKGIPGVLRFLDGDAMKIASKLAEQGQPFQNPQEVWDLLLRIIMGSKFLGAVDFRHFEIILRSILVLPAHADGTLEVTFIQRSAGRGRTFLDRCSFARANHVLLKAARDNETAAIADVGLRARVMMGGLFAQGGRQF